jgi:hypothetical protein
MNGKNRKSLPFRFVLNIFTADSYKNKKGRDNFHAPFFAMHKFRLSKYLFLYKLQH